MYSYNDHGHPYILSTVVLSDYWRAGASQPSRTTGTIFLFIGERERANLVVRLARFFCLFIYYMCLPPALHLADPAYKLRYFICDTRGPTRNHGKNTT